MQLRIQHFLRPFTFGRWREPALLRVVHSRPIGTGFTEIKMRPEIMRAETFKEFAVGTGTRRQFGRAFAVRKQHRAFMIFHMG